MDAYKLIEKEVYGQVHLLPVIYNKLQFKMNERLQEENLENSITVDSKRHQITCLFAMRFYKNIEIFDF